MSKTEISLSAAIKFLNTVSTMNTDLPEFIKLILFPNRGGDMEVMYTVGTIVGAKVSEVPSENLERIAQGIGVELEPFGFARVDLSQIGQVIQQKKASEQKAKEEQEAPEEPVAPKTPVKRKRSNAAKAK